MEKHLIRINDQRSVWMFADGISVDIEDLPFKVNSQHGHYLSIDNHHRKAAVFPFEVFRMEEELYYFGPEIHHHQVIRPSRVKWIRPPDLFVEPIPSVRSPHALAAIIILLWHTIMARIRDLSSHRASQVKTSQAQTFRGPWSALCLKALPLALFLLQSQMGWAPSPEREVVTQSERSIAQLQAASDLRRTLMTQESTATAALESGQGSSVPAALKTASNHESSPSGDRSRTRRSRDKRCSALGRESAFLSAQHLRLHYERCSQSHE